MRLRDDCVAEVETVKIVDANVLLYAVNEDADRHHESRTWLDGALSGGDTVAFTWVVLLAFARLSTKRGIFPTPLTLDQALDRVDAWLAAPAAVLLEPDAEHAWLLRQVMSEADASMDLFNDGHLAALAKANRASVVTYDLDFDRFSDVRWSRPDELIAE